MGLQIHLFLKSTIMADNTLIEKATFIQHHLPGLDAGEYAIELQHRFAAADTDSNKIPGGLDLTAPLLYKFAVKGPQFALDPTVVHGVFPPKDAVGEFSNVLPHIVLNSETLPWLRLPFTPANGGGPVTDPFKDNKGEWHDRDMPTWLAVLILTGTDTDLTEALQQTTVKQFFSNGADVFISPVQGDDPSNQPPWVDVNASVQALKLPINLFSTLAPALADLFMMANVRKVSLGNKPASPGADLDDVGTYSIVLGNRIPVSGQRHLAVLVSLENMGDYLPDHNGAPSTLIPANTTYALLPVLYAWHFTSQGDSFKFEHLLESLNGRAPDGKPQVPGPLPQPRMRLYPPANANVPTPIQLGYVPMKHTTRNNVETASWYRGPLAPYKFDANAGQAIQLLKTENGQTVPAIYDADALLRFDPSVGMFDLSYASAWQLGRLLALQDRNFSLKLYQWKRAQTSAVVNQLEEDFIQETFTTILADNDGSTGDKTKDLLEGTMQALIRRTERFRK